jgi:hypothetical protein
MSYNRRYDAPSWVAISTTVAATTLIATSGYAFYQLVQSYGWEGALSYIWEGDPHPSHVRDRIQTLEMTEKKLDKKEKVLSTLEECLERARLDSVDGSDAAHIRSLWEKNITAKDLKKELSFLSYDLDQVAAIVDDVKSGDQAEIKASKKTLSSRAVLLMERTDTLIEFFKSE